MRDSNNSGKAESELPAYDHTPPSSPVVLRGCSGSDYSRQEGLDTAAVTQHIEHLTLTIAAMQERITHLERSLAATNMQLLRESGKRNQFETRKRIWDPVPEKKLSPHEIRQAQREKDEKIWRAAQDGDLQLTNDLIRDGANIQSLNSRNQSALYLATAKGHLEVVTCLLQAGARIVCHPEGDKDIWDISCLAMAVGKKHVQIVEVLLKHGADVNGFVRYEQDMFSRSERSWNKLNNYCRRDGHIERSSNECPVIFMAIATGCQPMIQLLLSAGADTAATSGHDYCPYTPLCFALQLFDDQIVTLLLDAGVDMEAKNREGDTALKWLGKKLQNASVGERYLEMMVLLLERGANFKAIALDSRIYFHFLSSWENKEKAYWLASKFCAEGGDPDEHWVDQRPIAIAAAHGNEMMVKLFIDHGADVKQHSFWSEGPIVGAVENGHISIVDLLLAHGADPDTERGSLLLDAAKKGRTNIVKRLLESGANIKVKDSGITAVMYACLRKDVQMERLLTQAGADLESERAVYLELGTERRLKDLGYDILRSYPPAE